MKPERIFFLLTIAFLFFNGTAPYARADSLYNYYIRMAHEALDQDRYDQATHYFDTAHAVEPLRREPVYYLNLIKRLKENRVAPLRSSEAAPTRPKEPTPETVRMKPVAQAPLQDTETVTIRANVTAAPKPPPASKDVSSQSPTPKKQTRSPETPVPAQEKKSDSTLDKTEAQSPQEPVRNISRKPTQKRTEKPASAAQPSQGVIKTVPKEKLSKRIPQDQNAPDAARREIEYTFQEKIVLDDELWAMQPDTTIEVQLKKYVMLAGQNIKRFLVLNPGAYKVERIDGDTIEIRPLHLGSSIMHVWDDRGRWTFNIKAVLPFRFQKAREKAGEDFREEENEPFTVSYSSNWASYYQGDSVSELERTSLHYRQTLSMEGDTPYGRLFGFAGFTMFAESTELVNQGIGLSDGRIGPFEDFTIRAWDFSKGFSDLSLPRRSMRGGLLEAYAFHRKMKYTVFQGSDRARYAVISPGVADIKKSYLQGVRLTLFPDTPNRYSLNYARGWGEERPSRLKDKVFSVETYNRFRDIDVHTEVGYDEDTVATRLSSAYSRDDYTLRLNVRDIDKDYRTISSTPGGAGEVGGELRFFWDKNDTRIDATAELYRDREFFNPDNKNGVNFLLRSYVYKPLSESVKWNASFNYRDTSQLVSPQRSFRMNNRITRSFDFIKDHPFSVYVGHGYNRRRYEFSNSTDYDRNELQVGFNARIIKNLNYFLNYRYSWVKAKESSGIERPRVLFTGFNYSRRLIDGLSARINMTYRNEEHTEGDFSFLSGADTLRGSLGLSYRPYRDVEIFADVSGRNVWSEGADQRAYNEAEIRLGMTATFDTLFRWSPKGVISGKIYKDLNANQLWNTGEPGIPDVQVYVGNKTVTSNAQGEYSGTVRAKKARVEIVADTLPTGYVLSSKASRIIPITQGQETRVNFGLTTHSGIYGVVYVDANTNGKLDSEDVFVSDAKVVLDGDMAVYSNTDGSYFFSRIEEGRHTLTLDVNSLPLKYIPQVKVRNKITVKEGTTYTFNIPLKEKSSR
jgi:hypothetical protein